VSPDRVVSLRACGRAVPVTCSSFNSIVFLFVCAAVERYNTHENPPHGHECFNSTVSAHAFSEDAFTWFMSPTSPYGTQARRACARVWGGGHQGTQGKLRHTPGLTTAALEHLPIPTSPRTAHHAPRINVPNCRARHGTAPHHGVRTDVGVRRPLAPGFGLDASPHTVSRPTKHPSVIQCQVAMTSGGAATVATRERPKVYFNEKWEMTHLINGVCSASGMQTVRHRTDAVVVAVAVAVAVARACVCARMPRPPRPPTLDTTTRFALRMQACEPQKPQSLPPGCDLSSAIAAALYAMATHPGPSLTPALQSPTITCDVHATHTRCKIVRHRSAPRLLHAPAARPLDASTASTTPGTTLLRRLQVQRQGLTRQLFEWKRRSICSFFPSVD